MAGENGSESANAGRNSCKVGWPQLRVAGSVAIKLHFSALRSALRSGAVASWPSITASAIWETPVTSETINALESAASWRAEDFSPVPGHGPEGFAAKTALSAAPRSAET